jgi:Methylamine utilisation protein MauE/AhpC/TSA family
MSVETVLFDGLRFAVGLTLALAAAAKVRRPGEFVQGVGEYRVLPGWAVPATAWAVIAAEALAAVALLSGTGRPAGAAVAAVLGTVFAGAIGVNLRRHRRLRCHCFGTSETLGARSLVRALLLVAAASTVLLWPDPPSAPPSWSAETAVSAAIGLAVVLVAGRLLAFREPEPEPEPEPEAPRPEPEVAGLPVGGAAPRFTAPLADSGEPFDSASLPAGPMLIIFTAIGCKVCGQALPGLYDEAAREGAVAVVVCAGPPDACAGLASAGTRDDVTVVCDRTGSVIGGFRVSRVPSAVLVSAERTIVRHVACTPPPAPQPAASASEQTPHILKER